MFGGAEILVGTNGRERVAKKGERGRRHGRRMGWEEGEETVLYKQQTCISEDSTDELYIVPDSQPI